MSSIRFLNRFMMRWMLLGVVILAGWMPIGCATLPEPAVGPDAPIDSAEARAVLERLQRTNEKLRNFKGIGRLTIKQDGKIQMDERVAWIGSECCSMGLRHDDGWRSWYVHLNNDTPGTNDGQGQGVAPGLAVGTRVRAGQLLGWVGESGLAEPHNPHLHFELRDPSGVIVNPYQALRAAEGEEVPDTCSGGTQRSISGAASAIRICFANSVCPAKRV